MQTIVHCTLSLAFALSLSCLSRSLSYSSYFPNSVCRSLFFSLITLVRFQLPVSDPACGTVLVAFFYILPVNANQDLVVLQCLFLHRVSHLYILSSFSFTNDHVLYNDQKM